VTIQMTTSTQANKMNGRQPVRNMKVLPPSWLQWQCLPVPRSLRLWLSLPPSHSLLFCLLHSWQLQSTQFHGQHVPHALFQYWWH
jgi:hypothetical protein